MVNVTHARDRETGRFKHEMGVIGAGSETQGEVAECQLCGKVFEYCRPAGAPDRNFKSIEAARKAGLVFFEGY